ncbi:MAG: threonine ammonia-lyase [Gaiellaceae bacterium]
METPTPFEQAPEALAAFAGRDDLWLKREDVNEIGVFKWRGALPVVEELARRGHEAVVTASTGNHGAAVAWACRQAGIRAVVFVPPGAAEPKLANLDRLGADVRVAGHDLDEAKEFARTYAEQAALQFFEDGAEPLQYDAYGAIGAEAIEQCPLPPAAVVTPIGNGALAGGIGVAVARLAPGATRVGVVAREMPVMADSHAAGYAVEAQNGSTIADGLAVRVAIPLAVERLRAALDVMVRVSEREIALSLAACHDAGVPIEPSAAAAVAAVRRRPEIGEGGGPIVLVLTGRNVDATLVERARQHVHSFPD